MARTRKAAPRGHLPADPTALPRMVAAREVKKVKAQMSEKYGMEISDAFAADVIALIDELIKGQAKEDA